MTKEVDVYEFTISAKHSIEQALAVATLDPFNGKPRDIKSWSIKDGSLRFCTIESTEREELHKFITSPTVEELARTIISWLKDQDYPEEPDLDGHNSKGWTITNQCKANFADNWYVLFKVSPQWISFHK